MLDPLHERAVLLAQPHELREGVLEPAPETVSRFEQPLVVAALEEVTVVADDRVAKLLHSRPRLRSSAHSS